MSDDTVAPFLSPAVSRKKVTAAFDGGRITSDGGVMLLAAAERRIGMADRRPAQPAVRDAQRGRHSARFWEHKSHPLSGRRPQASLKPGSVRR